jgi:RNA polymerase primary sigma factor
MKTNCPGTLKMDLNRAVAPNTVLGAVDDGTINRLAGAGSSSPVPGFFRLKVSRNPGVSAEAPDARGSERLTRREPASSFTLYIREIGQVQLLSPENEAALARRVQRGDAAARELMIKANLRLVVKIAHDFEGFGLPLLDLISEGNLGLMRAVERYDPAKGAKLSTYAAFYIKQRMRRAIADTGRLIRLPVYAQEKLLAIHRAETRLRGLLGRTPSDEEISDEIRLSAIKVRRLRTAALAPVSLDTPQDEDGTNPVSDTVADEAAPSPGEELTQEDTATLMQELMLYLPPRELQIIRQRFGFTNGGEKTLDEIGHKMGLTRERIRQLQNSALAKLRKRLKEQELAPLTA